MDDNIIQNILTTYQNAQMKILDASEMEGWDHTFSRSFLRKMKRLLRYEKRYGINFRKGYLIHRLAVIAIVIVAIAVSSVTANRIIKKGFVPWRTDVQKTDDGRNIIYHKQNKNKKKEGQATPKKRLHDFPAYVPDGFKITEMATPDPGYDGADGFISYEKGKSYIDCGFIGIWEEMHVFMNTEHDWKKDVIIGGYKAELFHRPSKKNAVKYKLIWDDSDRNYSITSIGISENEIIRMARSLYE